MKPPKIKTTKEVRDLYAKHLNRKYIDRINGDKWFFGADTCYMCTAAKELRTENEAICPGQSPFHSLFNWQGEQYAYCIHCPLSRSRIKRYCTDFKNSTPFIEDGYVGGSLVDAGVATDSELKKRMNWIIKQIHKWTDCEIVNEK
ncbi:MAG: hypothetical protein GWN01_02555 [Nitrosopumilaceae archaeon]|nr:hypothetical protein [Nitrosopumilaceae archaeon]NIT99848.1 hypothetical protein [Nitrosopumilaceae archaeon]NIU86211.1 hypothetical protein [Nitrosopumilaceae archaeon]NIV64973.1 hypothetical protein [Nitrosopumilaceae archaeon]NIX60451.1 hypothetical protein [Nitrosopumilaceae archaeon]